MNHHAQWEAAGRNVSPGSLAWHHAFSHTWEPAPPPPDTPTSPIGRAVSATLADLRERRKGSPMRQARAPRKPRKRRGGELTISEYAAIHGIGPRQLRKRLLDIGILQTEIEIRSRGDSPPEYLHTARLTPHAVERSLGRRLEPRSGTPYDVLTRDGQEWVASRLHGNEEPKVSARHAARETIRGFLCEGKTQAEIARITGLSRQLVSHHARKFAA